MPRTTDKRNTGTRELGVATPRVGTMLAALALATSSVWAQEIASSARLRVGVVLSGGSARGMAHTGVLEWLEEHQIPVDRIAGTSTGAVIGAAYATGMSAGEIKTLFQKAEWDIVLDPSIPYSLRSYRRKEDDRDYAVKLEGGLLHGFRLQSGLNPGHHLGLLVSRVLLPYSGVSRFDDLPIPFRCVATDLEKGEVVVFDRGLIAPAVRASMSLPGAYDPVRLNGRLLADGGILNNVPVDVARAMGAEIVIAVKAEAADWKPAESIAGVANRAIALMMKGLETPQLQQADVVILPDSEGLTSGDFPKSNEFVARGYAAAEAQRDALLRYALDDASWAKYRAELETRKKPRNDPVSFVEVKGVADGAGAQIAKQLSRHIGQAQNPDEIEKDLNRIIGLGRYASATYGRLHFGETAGLGVDIRGKSYGPPFVNFSFEVNNESKDINLNLGSRITFMDMTGLGSEWRIDTSLGSTLSFGAELYQPLGGERAVRGGAFLSPRAVYARTSENLYTASELVAIYGRQRVSAGFDFGWNSGGRTRFRAGYDIAYVKNVTRVGDPLLPRSIGAEQAFGARFDYDSQNAPHLASRGVRFTSSARWFIEAPDAFRRFGTVEGTLRAARPVSGGKIATVAIDAGSAFGGRPPVLYQFSLGGSFRLGAYPPYAFRGPKYLLGGVGYRVPMGRLPKLVGGRLYLDTLVEGGSVFDEISNARLRSSVTAGLAADTLLGPIFAGASVEKSGDVRVYFMLGRTVR